jgi:ABC-2 type transport system permease protein
MLVYQAVQGKSTAPSKYKIGCVDETGIFDGCTEQNGVTFVLYQNEEESKKALLAKKTKEYIVIPENYLTTGSITRFTTERELEPSNKTIKATKDFLLSNLLKGENLSDEMLERVKNPVAMSSLRLDEKGELAGNQNPFLNYFVPYIFGLLFLFSIFFTSGYMLQGVAEEKENRVIEILLSSVSAKQLLVGKVLGLGAAGLLQVVVWLVSIKVFSEVASVNIPALSELSIPNEILILGVVYFLLGYFLFGTLYAALGSIGSTAKESQQWTSIFAFPAVLPYILQYFIIMKPDHIITKIFTIFPLTAPITVVMRLPAGIPIWQLVLSLAVLAISVVVAMWAAAKVFRMSLLMYGRKPTFSEIFRCVRER